MTATRPAGPDTVVPGLHQGGIDYGAAWRQVEVETARVVVIDLERVAILTGRLMHGAGERHAFVMPDSPLDRLFPRADALVMRWAKDLGSEPAALVVHKLSPRHWTYFWRLGPKVAMLAAVRHRYGRGAVAAGDAATIQLLCEHWLAPEVQAMSDRRVQQKRWKREHERSGAAARRELRAALAVMVLAAVCGLWLAAGGASPPPPDPRAPSQAEHDRLVRLSDETLQRALARALADRNPMQVQLSLDDHLFLGHFGAAVVLDDAQQVVAQAGLAASAPPGQPLPAAASKALGAGVRTTALSQGGQAVGQLLMAPRPLPRLPADAGRDDWGDTAQRVGGGLLALAAVLVGVRLGRRMFQGGR